MAQPFITSANAKELQAKATAARKRNAINRKLALATPQASQSHSLPCSNPGLTERAHAVELRIERALDGLATCETARDMQALATALDKLYQVWSLLTGHARPAPAKPKRGVQMLNTDGLPTAD